MQKFLVLFLAPTRVLDDWMKKDESERKEVEAKMKVDWDEWTVNNKDAIVDMPSGAGKVKKITKEGTVDSRNDIMMYAVVQAESHDAASAIFVRHPHLDIPEASIEVMTIRAM
jgi:hypothetical protein